MSQKCLSLVVLVVLGCVQVGYAQDGTSHDGKPDRSSSRSGSSTEKSESGLLGLLPADSVTEHSLKIDGRDLSYKATAGTLSLFGRDGERSAAIFYTSYVAEHTVQDRPVTFVFNGGPGASSAYLHLGLVGPKI